MTYNPAVKPKLNPDVKVGDTIAVSVAGTVTKLKHDFFDSDRAPVAILDNGAEVDLHGIKLNKFDLEVVKRALPKVGTVVNHDEIVKHNWPKATMLKGTVSGELFVRTSGNEWISAGGDFARWSTSGRLTQSRDLHGDYTVEYLPLIDKLGRL